MTEENHYEDIIRLPHPVSARHKPMTAAARAAQFAPFAALTGYEEAVQETARLTERAPEMDEESLCELNRRFMLLQSMEEKPEAVFTCFVPDGLKDGGRYETIRGRVRRMDAANREVLLTDGRVIEMDRITALEFPHGNENAD